MTGLLAALLSGCGGDSGGRLSPATVAADSPETVLSPSAELGQKIFLDASLSASGQMSCASCHNPKHAHSQDNDLAVQLGGPNSDQAGLRAVPSLRYLGSNPGFFFDSEGTPTGGFDRDGRAQSLAEQARRPFLAAHEMANAVPANLAARLRNASYAQQFQEVFGAAIFDDPDSTLDRAAFAVQQYQKEDLEFRPFNSRYDYFLAGKASLDAAELRGLTLFNRADKGNCAACHPSARGADGSPPLFTDFTYDNLGLPRNTAIPANADPAYFDLGLCGPERSDLAARGDLCGAFKVPTLRNVATRRVFFHNGVFHSLRDALRFYVRRDTNPEEWYPIVLDGAPQKFNDLPPPYRQNVNLTEGPYNRVPGMAPALSEQEIDDLLRFLETLNDGYQPSP